MSKVLDRAREVFDIEITGLETVKANLGDSFEQLVAKCYATLEQGGKLVVTGVGKSGYIGKKMAATLASLGSPSVFMHPVEALHGDLGIMQRHDLLIALSYSGETEELLNVLVPAKRLGIELVAITGFATSRLAKMSELTVEMAVPQEACPFNLAPTTTTTALLALGDALALVLLQERGFTKADYGRLHPGGAIGRAVTMRTADIMRTGERFAVVKPGSKVREALLAMSSARCGCAIIADDDGSLQGIFTDGDFRRAAEKDLAVLTRTMAEVMTPKPFHVRQDALAVEAVKMVEDRHINAIVVVDDAQKVVGLIDIQDLPGLKLL